MGCSDCDEVGTIGIHKVFDVVVGWEEGVEALKKSRIAGEEGGDAFNDVEYVDSLGLEILHDIYKMVIHIRPFIECNPDHLEVGKRILHSQPSAAKFT
jgi:hypothetical protein